MVHYIVELEEHPEIVVEVCNPDEAIIFKKKGEESFRVSFKEFDQILEAVARGECFGAAR